MCFARTNFSLSTHYLISQPKNTIIRYKQKCCLYKKNHEHIEMLKKETTTSENLPQHPDDKGKADKKCKLCERTFMRNCDLEKHMKDHEEKNKI